MFAYVVFYVFFQHLTKILTGKNISEMTYFVSRVGHKTLTQSLIYCIRN